MSDNEDPFYESSKEKDKLDNLLKIEIDGILKKFSKEDIKEFVYDLLLIFSIMDNIENNYSDGNIQLEKDIKKFNQLIKDWNLKYQDILLKTSGFDSGLLVYLREKQLSNLVPVIKKMNRFKEIEVSEEKIEAFFEHNEQENTLTITKKDNLKLVYLKEDMLSPSSPEFRICIYFGLKNGFNKAIDLQNYSDEFSFDIENVTDAPEMYQIKFILWNRLFN